MCIQIEDTSEQCKSLRAQLAELSTQVAKLIIQLEHYKPRSKGKDSHTEQVKRTEGTGKFMDSTETKKWSQEYKVTNYKILCKNES